MTRENTTNEALEILKSLVSDIEAMRAQKMDKEMDDEYEDDGAAAFGPFGMDMEGRDGQYISWPNLAIMLDKAKEFLKGASS